MSQLLRGVKNSAVDVPSVSAVVPLLKALACGELPVRREAAAALGRLGAMAAPAVPALAEALRDADMKLRLSAATALGAIGPAAAEAIPALVAALQGSHMILGRLAAQALSRIGVFAVPALTEALRHADGFVRREAAWALGEIGPAVAPVGAPVEMPLPPAIEPAGAEAPTRDPHDAATVRVYLGRAELERNIQAAAGIAPCPVEPVDPLTALLTALHDEDAKVRAAAAQALTRTRGSR